MYSTSKRLLTLEILAGIICFEGINEVPLNWHFGSIQTNAISEVYYYVWMRHKNVWIFKCKVLNERLYYLASSTLLFKVKSQIVLEWCFIKESYRVCFSSPILVWYDNAWFSVLSTVHFSIKSCIYEAWIRSKHVIKWKILELRNTLSERHKTYLNHHL